MDGKKPTTRKPGDFSNDTEKLLAETREALRLGEESLAPLRLPPDENRGGEYLARYYKDSEKRRKQFDKELKEGSIQRREFQAKLHNVSMGVLSRLESKITERPQVREETSTARPVGQGNTRKPHNVHHDPLKALIGTTKRDHPGISHRDLCRGLDVKRAELPRGSTWQKKSGERSWIGNCDCDAVRPLMDTYFSKIPPASAERKSTK